MKKVTKAFRILTALGVRESFSLLFALLKGKDRNRAWARFFFDYTQRRFATLFAKAKAEEAVESPFPKTIFFFWWDGFEAMPEVPRLCYRALQLFFPDYEILFLDKDNVTDYVEPTDIVYRRFLAKTVSVQNFSDYLRMTMIEKVGGYWVDSTLLFLRRFPLEELLADGRCFGSAYGRNNRRWLDLGPDFLTWNAFFVAGRKNSLVAKTFCECFREHYRRKKYPYFYFMVDTILYAMRKEEVGGDDLKRTLSIDGDFNFAFQNGFLVHSKDEWEEWLCCPQKLNWRVSMPQETMKSIEKILQEEKSATSLR